MPKTKILRIASRVVSIDMQLYCLDPFFGELKCMIFLSIDWLRNAVLCGFSAGSLHQLNTSWISHHLVSEESGIEVKGQQDWPLT